jgi:Tfp pilus assembly protein PilX
MRRRLGAERGSALITAIIVMGIMLGLGLATFATVDTQQSQSGGERISESAFNLSEGALNTQSFILSRDWPGTAAGAYPSTCTSTAATSKCPDPAVLASTYNGVDFASGASWTTMVRDDGGSGANYYDDTSVMAQPSWDANGNHRIWLRSQAIVRAKKRTVVALVKVQEATEQFPRNALTAGYLATNNNGAKVIVSTQGRPAALRCANKSDPACNGSQPGQISPDTLGDNYQGGNALLPDAIERLRSRAIADGTYYASGCPANPSGAVIFVEIGNCSYSGGTVNSPGTPGTLVIMNGTLSLSGNFTFYGLVYMANTQNTSGNVITMGGTAVIQGSVAIDGNAGILAGAS